MDKKVKKFRLRAKKFFFTYPQLSVQNNENLIEIALSHYEKVFMLNRDNFLYVAAIESHADLTPHLHIYLEFVTTQGIYSANKLDLTIDSKIFHGNYQVVRSEHNVIQYIIKSVKNFSDIITNKELPLYNEKYFSNMNEHLFEILTHEGYDAAVDVLYSKYSKHAIQRGSALLKNLALADYHIQRNKDTKILPKYSLSDFKDLPKPLVIWIETKEPPALLLFGPSGTGKTELAKALMSNRGVQFAFVRNKESLKEFRNNFHKGIIFDDLDTENFTREELIHLFDVDNESQIRILYGYVTLPPKLFKIFTTNSPTKFLRNDNALKRRLIDVFINKDILKIESNSSSLISDNTNTMDSSGVRVNDCESSVMDSSDVRVNIRESSSNNFPSLSSSVFLKPEDEDYTKK